MSNYYNISTIKLVVLLVMQISMIYPDSTKQANTNEVGILSVDSIDKDIYELKIYVISDSPVAGLQFGLKPDDLFEVLDVYGGKSENQKFMIHHNKKGTILGFSMTGAVISKSSSRKPEDNVAIKVKVKKIRDHKQGEFIRLNSILAAIGGTKIQAKDIDYSLKLFKKNVDLKNK